VIAVIERNINGRLGAGEEQSLLFGVLANDVQLAARTLINGKTARDACPGLAAVVRAIDVVLLRGRSRRSTAEANVCDGICRIDVIVAGFDQ
jgi:hypothetical protein